METTGKMMLQISAKKERGMNIQAIISKFEWSGELYL